MAAARMTLAEAVEQAAQDVRREADAAGLVWGGNNRNLRQTQKRVRLQSESGAWRMQRSVLIERTAKYGWDYAAILDYIHAANPDQPRAVIYPDRHRQPVTVKLIERSTK